MQFVEYGREHSDVVILLHGGGLCWWNYREEAELLQDSFHVILPILDGHAGSEFPFAGVETCARRIIDYIDSEHGGSVLFIGGLSLGGQVLLEMLSLRKDICKYAFIESAAVIPSPVTGKLIAPAFASSYGLITRRWFSKLQFASMHIKPELFESYYADTCRISKDDLISFTKDSCFYEAGESLKDIQTRVRIFAGGKENRRMKASAKKLRQLIPGSSVEILRGLHHGEFSLNYAEQYAEKLRCFISDKK